MTAEQPGGAADAPREREIDGALFDGFLLGLHVVMEAYHIDPPATEADAPWDLLQAIADGRVTIAGDAAELAHSAQDAPELQEMLWRHVNRRVAKDREHAQRILAAMNRLTDFLEGGGAS